MKIKKSGYVYKLAYNWRPWRSKRPEGQISLCVLVWRALLTFFVIWPLTPIAVCVLVALLVCLAAILLCLLVVGTAACFCVGYFPNYKMLKAGPDMDTLPIPFLVNWKPIYFVGAAALVYIWHRLGLTAIVARSGGDVMMHWKVVIITSAAFLAIVAFCTWYFLDTKRSLKAADRVCDVLGNICEFPSVAKAYIKAKKQKVCPSVEVVD